jgi:hypothetical protein
MRRKRLRRYVDRKRGLDALLTRDVVLGQG